MHVLIIGASRGIGAETARAALRAGHRVRGFARSIGRLNIRNDRLDRWRGDALDSGDIDGALEGVDVVIQTLGVPVRRLIGPVRLFSDATRVVLTAMQQRGVRRLIAVTGFGAGESRSAISGLQTVPFRLLLGRAYDDKDIQEKLIRHSGLDWTIARPGVLLPGPGSGRYKVLAYHSQWRNGVISRADVADFLVKQVTSTQFLRQAPVLVCR